MPPFAAVSWQTGIGAVPLAAGALVESPNLSAVDAAGVLALLVSGIVANGLGFIAWFVALRRLPASLVSIGSLLVPSPGWSCQRWRSATHCAGAERERLH